MPKGLGEGDFREGARLIWRAVWDWTQVEEVVLSGDDVAWIEEGRGLYERIIRPSTLSGRPVRRVEPL